MRIFQTRSGRLAALLVTALTLSVHAIQIPEPTVEPKKIDPGTVTTAPSDAVILFDGKDTSQWVNEKGEPTQWDVKDGVMTVGKGDIFTMQSFGDCQLHVEWASPEVIVGEGQGRGNSGIFLQSHYEIQVLDSYTNKTYFFGQAGSVYKQTAPLVNACRKPGEWQTYDIIYHAPKFGEDGKVTTPARVTLLQNGVLVQDNTEIKGTTVHTGDVHYDKHGLKEPLKLQDHHNPVRYRNIWIREL